MVEYKESNKNGLQQNHCLNCKNSILNAEKKSKGMINSEKRQFRIDNHEQGTKNFGN